MSKAKTTSHCRNHSRGSCFDVDREPTSFCDPCFRRYLVLARLHNDQHRANRRAVLQGLLANPSLTSTLQGSTHAEIIKMVRHYVTILALCDADQEVPNDKEPPQ